jgi:molybdate transport system substrate-binding protein
MTLRTSLITLGLLGALGLCNSAAAQAAEVTILVNQGALSGVRDLAAGFEKASGHKVVIDFVGIPQQNEKIATDAPGDVLVNFLPTFEDLAKNSKVVAGTVVEFARAGNGVAVKAGAPKPDISTPEAFKQAMLNAKSIGHSNAGTGPYNTRMFQNSASTDQIGTRSKIVQGKPVCGRGRRWRGRDRHPAANVIQPVAGTPISRAAAGRVDRIRPRFGVAVRNVSKEARCSEGAHCFHGWLAGGGGLRKTAMEPPAR